jgi:hypothetical protein
MVITLFLYNKILIEVYNDLIYLPLGPFRNSFSVAFQDFAISTTNSVINPTTISSNQKSIARVNLLLTFYNSTISIGFHSSYQIRFVGWLYFNLNRNSCNKCGKSQKNTSCKSLNTYLSRYLCGVNLGFLLSFYANSSSFVSNHLSIFSFVGFHGMNIPFYTFILRMLLLHISFTQSYAVPAGNKTSCWLLLSLILLGLTQVQI